MEGLRYQVAKQRMQLGIEKKPFPNGKELVQEFLENAEKLLVKKEEGKEGKKEE